ncbi:anti-sigma-I factor RsgI family protein [Phosphitispora fastidiosa]|uniref:anti-sigma-I factor RsgI family protein n=1 Tax=Phosphitispora fastidiosa TaxID=2837202 RepID=UPI001E447C89|nr:hypothetical protein [Phosphitispora fastidiosa]MBU7006469.1 hypothetical protein [Phosphitispora fastidiosa]
MKIRGLVVKVKNPYYLILAADGTYHKVPLSGNPSVNVGAQAEFSTANRSFSHFRYLKQAALAASLLLVVLAFGFYTMFTGAEAAAYISLDINPSIELEIDDDLKVTGVNLLNPDAAKLMAKISLKGSSLSTAVELMLSRALQDGYLKSGEKNLILSTITLNGNSKGNIDLDSLAVYLEKPVANEAVDIEIVITSTDKALRDEAAKEGLSTGKLLVYKDALQSSGKLTIDQVKQTSITQLENELKIKILGNYKQRIVRKYHIADRFTGNEPDDDNGPHNSVGDKKQNNGNGNNANSGQSKPNQNSSGKAVKGNSSQVKGNNSGKSQPEQNEWQEQNEQQEQNLEPNQEQNQLSEQNQEPNQEQNPQQEEQGQAEEQREQTNGETSSGEDGQSGKTESNTSDSGKKQNSDTGTSGSSSDSRSGKS